MNKTFTIASRVWLRIIWKTIHWISTELHAVQSIWRWAQTSIRKRYEIATNERVSKFSNISQVWQFLLAVRWGSNTAVQLHKCMNEFTKRTDWMHHTKLFHWSSHFDRTKKSEFALKEWKKGSEGGKERERERNINKLNEMKCVALFYIFNWFLWRIFISCCSFILIALKNKNFMSPSKLSVSPGSAYTSTAKISLIYKTKTHTVYGARLRVHNSYHVQYSFCIRLDGCFHFLQSKTISPSLFFDSLNFPNEIRFFFVFVHFDAT